MLRDGGDKVKAIIPNQIDNLTVQNLFLFFRLIPLRSLRGGEKIK